MAVSKEGEPAQMFCANWQDYDSRSLVERCENDRHNFRFIVSPNEALEMTDLRAFTAI
jgi:type IV secretory pathway VirD2 relaxase